MILLGSPGVLPAVRLRACLHLGLQNPYAGEAEEGFEIAEEDFMVARLDEAPLALEGAVRWHPAFESRLKARTRARLAWSDTSADVAQLVEHHLAKVGVAGSNPVVRSSR